MELIKISHISRYGIFFCFRAALSGSEKMDNQKKCWLLQKNRAIMTRRLSGYHGILGNADVFLDADEREKWKKNFGSRAICFIPCLP